MSIDKETLAVVFVIKSSFEAVKSPEPEWFKLSIVIFILELSSKYLNLKFSTLYSLIFNANGLLSPSSFLFLSFKAMSKFPTPSLLKIIFIKPFSVEMASIFIDSSLPLNNSFIDIFKFNSPKETKVSPLKGALLIINNWSIETFACGKLLNKLKSASEKDTLASTFSFIASVIFALI